MPDAIALRDRIGGRWAISIRGWLLLSLLTILPLTLSTNLADDAPRRRLVVLAIALAAAAAFGLVLLIADRTAFRRRAERPVPIWWVAALGLLVGLSQSATANALFHVGGFQPNPYPLTRMILAMVLAPALVVGTALLLDDIDRFHRGRDELLRRAADLHLRVAERNDLTRTIEQAVNEEVLATTRSILGDLDQAHAGMTREERLEMARRLQRTAHDELRPLSRRLYATPSVPLPASRYRDALRATLSGSPISPGWTALALLIAAFAYTQERIPLENAVLQALAQGATVYATLWLVVRLASRSARSRGWLLLYGALAACATTTVKTVLFQQQGLAVTSATLVVMNAVWTPLATIIVGLLVAAFGTRGETLRDLEYEVDERALEALIANRELVRVSRELAGHVHGTLQSTLLATAFAIENATRSNDGAAFDAAVQGAKAALTMEYGSAERPADIAAEVQRHIDLWSEFTQMTATVDAVPPVSSHTVADVGRIVEEGIGNAKKHGGARRIHVAVEQPEPDVLRISIGDDGHGPDGGAPGLGTSLLDELAPGRWSLRSNPAGAGSLLIVDLAVG